MSLLTKQSKTKKAIKLELLKSYHEQFALNQNHHQSLFIQFISTVLIVIIGYGIIYSNTQSNADMFNSMRNPEGNILSYSVIHLIGTYFIAQSVLVLLGSMILNNGYGFRRDQKVNYQIRHYFMGQKLYQNIFGDKSFNPQRKGLIFNSFLPGFNLIFISFIYLLQFFLALSILIALYHLNNTNFSAAGLFIKFLVIVLFFSPLILSLRYFQHYYNKYKKTIN